MNTLQVLAHYGLIRLKGLAMHVALGLKDNCGHNHGILTYSIVNVDPGPSHSYPSFVSDIK